LGLSIILIDFISWRFLNPSLPISVMCGCIVNTPVRGLKLFGSARYSVALIDPLLPS
jgi:hypothetical protein